MQPREWRSGQRVGVGILPSAQEQETVAWCGRETIDDGAQRVDQPHAAQVIRAKIDRNTVSGPQKTSRRIQTSVTTGEPIHSLA